MGKWLLSCWLVGAAAAACAAASPDAEFTARVIIVLDGDTVMVVRACNGGRQAPPAASRLPACVDNKPLKVRLAEIDAPEKEQPGGMESKQSLSGMVLKRRVSVDVQTVDKYGRLVAHLAVNGRRVSEEQLRRGMAWEYSNYHSNKTYVALEREAQRARRGLWAQAGAVPPWEWRKLHAGDEPRLAQAHTSGTAEPEAYACGSKRFCSEMSSCAEARFYLAHCGAKSLDGNGDGMPCETLCGSGHGP